MGIESKVITNQSVNFEEEGEDMTRKEMSQTEIKVPLSSPYTR